MSDPLLDMPVSTPLGYALRTGTLHVTEILYGAKQPFRSVVEIAGADIVSDVTHYYRQVEQVPTHLDLDTYLVGDKIMFSGGLLVQPLPQATPEEAEELLQTTIKRLRGCVLTVLQLAFHLFMLAIDCPQCTCCSRMMGGRCMMCYGRSLMSPSRTVPLMCALHLAASSHCHHTLL